jgi:DNA polymerase III alpha subunit
VSYARSAQPTVGTLSPDDVEHEECWLRSPGEMAALFGDVPEALANTVHIAWSCRYEIPVGRPRPPRFAVPDDAARRRSVHKLPWRRTVAEELGSIPAAMHRASWRALPGKLPRCRNGRRNHAGSTQAMHRQRLRHSRRPRCFPNSPRPSVPRPSGFYRHFATKASLPAFRNPGASRRRKPWRRELDVIHRLDLTEYFLVCWDLVRFARRHAMPCLGRGSAANSLVSYCLYITHVNPLEHKLFFERFLNLERESFPDFDIDFGTDDREVVLDYIFERYGRENVAMICTYSTMHARGAIREVAKALGVGLGEIEPVVSRLPSFASARGLRDQIGRDPARRHLPLDREPFRSILEIAECIAEFPRHLATHPCGVVIAPEPITHIVPLQRGDKGLEITQWDMNASRTPASSRSTSWVRKAWP